MGAHYYQTKVFNIRDPFKNNVILNLQARGKERVYHGWRMYTTFMNDDV